MILEIALGVVLAVIIIELLPLILYLAARLLFYGVIAVGVFVLWFAGYKIALHYMHHMDGQLYQFVGCLLMILSAFDPQARFTRAELLEMAPHNDAMLSSGAILLVAARVSRLLYEWVRNRKRSRAGLGSAGEAIKTT